MLDLMGFDSDQQFLRSIPEEVDAVKYLRAARAQHKEDEFVELVREYQQHGGNIRDKLKDLLG
jgi:hypothetical protein